MYKQSYEFVISLRLTTDARIFKQTSYTDQPLGCKSKHPHTPIQDFVTFQTYFSLMEERSSHKTLSVPPHTHSYVRRNSGTFSLSSLTNSFPFAKPYTHIHLNEVNEKHTLVPHVCVMKRYVSVHCDRSPLKKHHSVYSKQLFS